LISNVSFGFGRPHHVGQLPTLAAGGYLAPHLHGWRVTSHGRQAMGTSLVSARAPPAPHLHRRSSVLVFFANDKELTAKESVLAGRHGGAVPRREGTVRGAGEWGKTASANGVGSRSGGAAIDAAQRVATLRAPQPPKTHMLFNPARHEPLATPAWNDDDAEAAIRRSVDATLGGFEGPERGWPMPSLRRSKAI